MKNSFFINTLLLLLVFIETPAFSQELTAKQIFLRCFSQLTGLWDPSNGGRRALSLKDNDPPSKAIDLCMAILNTGGFDQDGNPIDSEKKRVTDLSKLNPEYTNVLKTFQQLHHSFFLFQDFQAADIPAVALSGDVYDSQTPAYYFTKALFQDLPLKYVVTTNETLQANRRATKTDGTEGVDPVFGPQSKIDKKEVSRNATFKFAPKGELVGIAIMNAPASVKSGDSAATSVELTAHLGGGILGSTPYLFAMQSRRASIKPNQGLTRHRSFAKAVMSDFLCREFPVVDETTNDVVPKASELDFEKNKTCYKCHTSMDPLSDIVGNLSYNKKSEVYKDSSKKDIPLRAVQFVTKLNENNKGKLYYRDTENTLHDESVIGVNGLGELLASQYDFYLCTAKRYYNYFMGVDIKLSPGLRKKTSDPKLSSIEKKHLSNVISLADYLKGTQDAKGKKVPPGTLKGLVKKIFELPEYRKSDFGIQ